MARTWFALVFFITGLMVVAAGAEAALVNPGFEDDFTGWTSYGSAAVVKVATMDDGAGGTATFLPCEGSKMASIGGEKGPLGPGSHAPFPSAPTTRWKRPGWNTYIMQDVVLGPDDKYLNFTYNFWTYDEAPFDNPGFLVEINGKTWVSKNAGDIGDGTLGTLDYTGWTGLSIPVAGYYSPEPRTATITLSFSAGNSGDNQYPSGAFIDGASFSFEPQYQVVPIPPAVLLLGSGLIGLIGLRRRIR